MKRKLTVTVQESLIAFGKAYASRHGMSLSQLIEDCLRRLAATEGPSFAHRWRGRLAKAQRHGDQRMHFLEQRYE